MKIAQVSSSLLQGDSIANVIRTNHQIQQDARIDSSILIDLISEYKASDIHELLIRDVAGFRPWTMIKEFLQMRNKRKYALLYARAFATYKPQLAFNILETADVRIFHNSGFLRSAYLMHKHDIFYFHNYTAPYLRDFFNGPNEMKLRIELLAHNDLDLLYITPSKFNKKTLDKLGVRYADVKILPLYHKYNLQYQRHNSDTPRLLGYGRYSRNKCVPALVVACSESNLDLAYFGDNNTLSEHLVEYKKALKQAKGNIRLFGKLKEIDTCFEWANIYVCNSAFEGFNMPAIEAMAHSIPVLLRSGTAMDEFFDKAERLGLKIGYAYDDPSEIPALVNRIIKDYDRCSHDAWKFSAHFTLDNYTKRYLAILHNRERHER